LFNVCYFLSVALIYTLLDLPTPEGRKAELTWVIGDIARWFTGPQTVTHPVLTKLR